MNKLTTLFLALLLSCSLSAQRLYVGTYNIRYNNPNDEKEGNAWTQRCSHLCDFINFEQPEIFGTQEVLVGQLHDLGWFYKLALLDFELIFEVKMQESEGV
ncbi:hypothetical protein HMPREF0661_03130 [Prevotella melaninogenica DNF00666]|uniref:Endonuclease n=1 Tax=Prevotella melaninogenica DNF00666 TaxID=1401073 RepID=A0A096D2N1_9BACT|nr:hypothetical protein HMPREF0661_03130 [Prevotella melaninogenica DNF00666]